jgi:hypothetical protein
MNFSAASSLSSLGSFFFMIGEILRVHVPGADRTDEALSSTLAKR